MLFIALIACITRENFPQRFFEATCDYRVACADETLAAECVITRQNTIDGLAWQIENGLVEWSAHDAEACIRSIEDATDTCADWNDGSCDWLYE